MCGPGRTKLRSVFKTMRMPILLVTERKALDYCEEDDLGKRYVIGLFGKERRSLVEQRGGW